MNKIVIASDHAAFESKDVLYKYLLSRGYDVLNLGTDSKDSCHYPTYAISLAREVQKGATGILLCGSGIGVSMVANKFRHVRAALCRSLDDAKMSRLHNDANVICLGGRVTDVDQMMKMVELFLATPFEGGRHSSRLDLFNNLGEA